MDTLRLHFGPRVSPGLVIPLRPIGAREIRALRVAIRRGGTFDWVVLPRGWFGRKGESRERETQEMIPDTEMVCHTPEVTLTSLDLEKSEKELKREAPSGTAWQRYQQFVAMMESTGEQFNRKSMLEAMFRGADLIHANQ